MLSYQHIYHAGNRADIHKHAILAQTLQAFIKTSRPSLYIETHAGRGLYDLRAAESLKTGEAGEGWLALVKDQAALDKLPRAYVESVKAINDGSLSPFYPGSPKIAAHMLRENDRIYAYEMHPGEFTHLKKSMGDDKRFRIEQADGLQSTLQAAKLHARSYDQALVLIDPSYEIKSEYETIPAFIADLLKIFPRASVLLWIPMLPAMRHEASRTLLEKNHAGLQLSVQTWSDPAKGRGMFGSIIAGINLPKEISIG